MRSQILNALLVATLVPTTSSLVSAQNSCDSDLQESCVGTDCAFDLKWGDVDANGIPMNPWWRLQDDCPEFELDPATTCGGFPVGQDGTIHRHGRPICTNDEVTLDRARGLANLFCSLQGKDLYRGHINWPVPATLETTACFHQIALDGDYNWEMEPLKRRLLSKYRKTLHVEARGKETVHRFGASEWWRKFNRKNREQKRDTFPPGTPAVVTGLLNLDNVHDAYPELHPAYVVALLVSSEPQRAAPEDAFIDTWALFLRTWGDEGFCSSKEHPLLNLPHADCDDGDCVWLAAELPLGSADDIVEVSMGTKLYQRGGVGTPELQRDVKRADHLIVRFPFPDCATSDGCQPSVFGVLELRRSHPSGTPGRVGKPTPGKPCKQKLRSTRTAGVDVDHEELAAFFEDAAEPRLIDRFKSAVEAADDRQARSLSRPLPIDLSEVIETPIARAKFERPSQQPGFRAAVAPEAKMVPLREERIELTEFEAMELEVRCSGALEVCKDPAKLVKAQQYGTDLEVLVEFLAGCAEQELLTLGGEAVSPPAQCPPGAGEPDPRGP